MRKIIDNIIRLKKYFKIAKYRKEIPISEILSSNESLKSFGRLWTHHSEDVMAMIALMEYEFIIETNYSDEQVKAVKQILSKITKFLIQSGQEWEEYEKLQNKKK